MTTRATSAKEDSALARDFGRDWRSWNAAERCSAITILSLAIAVPVALLILAPL